MKTIHPFAFLGRLVQAVKQEFGWAAQILLARAIVWRSTRHNDPTIQWHGVARAGNRYRG